MEHDFWHERWDKGQLGFHQDKVNSRLRKHWSALGLDSGERIFVPLCGKSLDMYWLEESGHPVLGVELSATACRDFFSEAGREVESCEDARFQRFSGGDIELWSGDFFALEAADLADVSGVYDRAALVALPPSMRVDYAAHMARVLARGTRVMLVSFDYDQSKMNGPPFSVPEDEVRSLFAEHFSIEIVTQASGPEILGNLADRGLDTLTEKVYLLIRR